VSLQPNHAALIAQSGISRDVAEARGYRTVTKKGELRDLGFSQSQARVPALLVPVHAVVGGVALYQIRPDAPRMKKGKTLKYETPLGARMALDVPPSARGQIGNPNIPLFITEGVRKADSAVSKGMCCVALLGVWNWRGANEDGGKVALADWEFVALNDRQVFVVFDSDVMLKPEVHGALSRLKAFLESRKARVAVIYLPPGGGGVKVGLDDYLAARHGVDDLLCLASSTVRPSPEEEAGPEKEPTQGQSITFEDPEPWPDPVDGAALLDEITDLILMFMVMSEEAARTAAAWAVYSHCYDLFDTSPILAIQSPTLGCGKSTLLRILEGITRRPYRAVGFTEATVFRLIEKHRPTLLIDEADHARDKAGLIEVINAGLERGGSVPRCVGEDNEVRMFSVWTPKAMAGIGGLAATVQDRAIVLTLQRATRDERRRAARFRARSAAKHLGEIRRRAARWVSDHSELLEELGQREEAPLGHELDARASEQLWLPLLSVADAVGGVWPTRLREAALVLSGSRRDGGASLGELLLQDLAMAFANENTDFLFTDDLLKLLNGLEERPWKGQGKRGEGLDSNGLASLLRPFGVTSGRRRQDGKNSRGYPLAGKLSDAISRYAATPNTEARPGTAGTQDTSVSPAATSSVPAPSATGPESREPGTTEAAGSQGFGNDVPDVPAQKDSDRGCPFHPQAPSRFCYLCNSAVPAAGMNHSDARTQPKDGLHECPQPA
jgi:putative DNA primase/helicase